MTGCFVFQDDSPPRLVASPPSTERVRVYLRRMKIKLLESGFLLCLMLFHLFCCRLEQVEQLTAERNLTKIVVMDLPQRSHLLTLKVGSRCLQKVSRKLQFWFVRSVLAVNGRDNTMYARRPTYVRLSTSAFPKMVMIPFKFNGMTTFRKAEVDTPSYTMCGRSIQLKRRRNCNNDSIVSGVNKDNFTAFGFVYHDPSNASVSYLCNFCNFISVSKKDFMQHSLIHVVQCGSCRFKAFTRLEVKITDTAKDCC